MHYGMTPSQAVEWLKTAEMLYGPTRYTRKQALAVQSARDNGHPPDTLAMINRHARGFDDAGTAWDLRVELSQRAESFHDLSKYARQPMPDPPFKHVQTWWQHQQQRTQYGVRLPQWGQRRRSHCPAKAWQIGTG